MIDSAKPRTTGCSTQRQLQTCQRREIFQPDYGGANLQEKIGLRRPEMGGTSKPSISSDEIDVIYFDYDLAICEMTVEN
jgi:hypothetical protein